jgi:hypothetical protein
MEMLVSLIDEVEEDRLEDDKKKMIVQMEIIHHLVMMEHVMLQVEDEMMTKK